MPVTATPIHVQTVKHTATAITATANTNVDGATGVYTTICTAGANGSKVERIRITSAGTTVADKVRIFIGASNTTGKLYQEILFAAATPSNTVTSLFVDIDCSQASNALYLAATEVIYVNVNTGTSSLFHANVFYGDY